LIFELSNSLRAYFTTGFAVKRQDGSKSLPRSILSQFAANAVKRQAPTTSAYSLFQHGSGVFMSSSRRVLKAKLIGQVFFLGEDFTDQIWSAKSC
jgi:hypothetical protein